MRTSDTTGRCEYPGLAPGKYTLIARAGTSCSSESPPVEVAEGQTRAVVLALEEGIVL